MRAIYFFRAASATFCFSVCILILPIVTVNASTRNKGETICVNAYWDNNGNGIREVTEGFIEGVPISLQAGDILLTQGVTRTKQAKCFFVEPGHYTVIMGEAGSQIIKWTTRNTWSFDIQSSSTVNLEFGVAQISAYSQDKNTTGISKANTPAQNQTFLGLIFSCLVISFSALSTLLAIASLIVNIKILKLIRWNLDSDPPQKANVPGVS